MEAIASNVVAGMVLTVMPVVAGFATWWFARHAAARNAPPARQPEARAGRPVSVPAELRPFQIRLHAIGDRMRIPRVPFNEECLPLIHAVAAHGYYAADSQNLRLLLDRTYHALVLRLSAQLPPGAGAAEMNARADRWTLGVFITSMLADVWGLEDGPATGDSLEASLRQWLSASTLRWLLQDAELADCLQQGLADPAADNPLRELVRNGHQAALGNPLPDRIRALAVATAGLRPAVPATSSGGALYIGSISLADTPRTQLVPPVQRANGAAPRRPAIETRTSQALADDFMQWVREGMADGSTAVNTAQAHVHFAAEGMVLTWPAAFEAYVGACAVPPINARNMPTTRQRSKEVLRAVCEVGWNLHGPIDSQMLHFQLVRAGEAPSHIRGVVIKSPQRFLDELPPPNPALSRVA